MFDGGTKRDWNAVGRITDGMTRACQDFVIEFPRTFFWNLRLLPL